jgi:hypothetical protein
MSDAQAATADTPETPEAGATETTETATVDIESLTAELEKLKSASRKWEDRAKANSNAAKELETLRQASMTDQEQAVAKAAAEAEARVRAEVGSERVEDAVRAAVGARSVDVEALLEGMDRTRFLDDNHQPDRDAIAAWVDRIAPAQDPSVPQTVDLGQGARGGMPDMGDPLLADLKSALGL